MENNFFKWKSDFSANFTAEILLPHFRQDIANLRTTGLRIYAQIREIAYFHSHIHVMKLSSQESG